MRRPRSKSERSRSCGVREVSDRQRPVPDRGGWLARRWTRCGPCPRLRLQEADDVVVFERAAREGRVIVSADTDFGTLLAVRREAAPSVILFRRGAPRIPSAQVELLVANLPNVSKALDAGSVVVFEKARVRLRALPIVGEE